MNPLIYWLISHTVAKGMTRRCPKCYRVQMIPKAKQNEPVRCKWCGALMPPKPK